MEFSDHSLRIYFTAEINVCGDRIVQRTTTLPTLLIFVLITKEYRVYIRV